MDFKKWLILAVILLIAFSARLYKVTEIPPSLNWDEVSIGYNAYSILKTGKDEWNQFLPLHFKSYGEYKLPVQIYGSIPGIAIFGLNELGVRITPVLYGTATVLVVFFLTLALFEASAIALIAAFLMAISPWHIHLTRASFESSFALFWFCLGLLFFIKSFKNRKYFLFSMIPFAISIYTYNTARVFTPLFIATNLLIYFKDFAKYKKIVFAGLILFAIMLTPLIPFILSGEGSARYKLVSITDDPGLVLRINEGRGNSNLPTPFPRLVHNKVTYVTAAVLDHYFAHFTPQFLFVSGAPHRQHHVQGMGELYYFQAPFLILGLILLFRKKEKFRWVLISWVMLAYIPVAVTNDSIPHALRTLIAVPFYQIVSAYGGYYFFKFLLRKSKILFFVVLLVTVIFTSVNLFNYFKQYYTVYPYEYSRDWQYGYKQVVDYIKLHENEYDKIVFSRHFGEPHMFLMFFKSYDPSLFQNAKNLNRFETFDWIRVLEFDKYYFPDLGDEGTRFEDVKEQFKGQKLLFIGKSGDFPETSKVLYKVDFLNGNPAFVITDNSE